MVVKIAAAFAIATKAVVAAVSTVLYGEQDDSIEVDRLINARHQEEGRGGG